ncbi:cytochrome P450 [Streptomyces sp. NPDC004539]|uniref:cytochrome P450 n=1 Tax=Streptomyces sp. NPDC004539 TaxID=3154280 RepID=UPI00339FD5CE
MRALTDRTNRAEPYALLRAIREHGPFRLDPDIVVVARPRDCAKVLRDPTVSSERDRNAAARGRTRLFVHLDPPDHTRLRRLVVGAFAPHVVTALTTRVREIVGGLLDAAAPKGRCEIVADFAFPLPVRVISELLGVPHEDRARFQDWSAALGQAVEPPLPGLHTPELSETVDHARVRLITYFRTLIARRRDEPAEDLLSRLIHARDGEGSLSESELLATCVLLLNAGHENTVNLIGNGVLALLRHPEQLAALRRDPTLADAAVEETLRYDAPVQLTTRIARRPGRIGDTEVREGDTLVLLLAAANRDPALCPEPDRFDLTRGAAPHLSFAAGPHFCLGAALARLEVAIALEQFAARVVRPRLASPTLTYKPNLTLRGLERLEITYESIGAGRPAPAQ